MNQGRTKKLLPEERRRVAILQSSYIPWKGYFDIIHDVDLFIFYDDVQYTLRDWRNRNRVKTARGVEWLTIPTNGTQQHLICDVQFTDPKWQIKHWETLRHVYGKAPYFERYRPFLQDVYLGQHWTHLSELNQYLIKEISREFLGISTRFADSRQYHAVDTKQERIKDLLKKAGATLYVSGPSAKNYIDEAKFAEAGIELVGRITAAIRNILSFFRLFNIR